MGPLPVTVVHFWRMIFEQNVTLIISVCNLSEGGRVKCHKFWPDVSSAEDPKFKKILGQDVIVTEVSQEQLGAFLVLRHFEVRMTT